MKIITFWGGLGNQIFEYAYYVWMKEKYPNEKIYGYYPAVGLADHNGLEVNKRFNVELPPSSTTSNLIASFLFNANRVLRRLGLHEVCTCTQKNAKYESTFHCDYWQDKKYLTDSLKIDFNLDKLSEKNAELVSQIEAGNVVAVHVRRGDYLTSGNASTYGGICTEEYYRKAIAEIQKKFPDAQFLFFSDDSQYVRDTYQFDNMQIVDWNKGEDSIYDMYLMSRCKYMILANSTFSYWAACLNKSAKIICCPTKWTNGNAPDIILENWKKIK